MHRTVSRKLRLLNVRATIDCDHPLRRIAQRLPKVGEYNERDDGGAAMVELCNSDFLHFGSRVDRSTSPACNCNMFRPERRVPYITCLAARCATKPHSRSITKTIIAFDLPEGPGFS
jgi:hypothetical protein